MLNVVWGESTVVAFTASLNIIYQVGIGVRVRVRVRISV